jgi:outer membrane protein assembly factor BamB
MKPQSPHFLSIIFLLFSTLVFGADSSMFRGDARHSGVYDAPGVPQFHNVKWKFKTNGRVLSSPAVIGDMVYVGSTDHNLYAVDRETGTQKWKFRTGSGVVSSPAVADGIVYFTSYDGNFYAIETESGKLKWKFKTGGEHRFTAKHIHGAEPSGEAMPDPFDVYLSSPVIWKDAVYFGSGDGNVYSLDAASGTLKWKFQTGNVVHASPAIADGVLYIGSWDTNFYALDASTGKEVWRFKTGEDPDIHNQEGIQSSAVVSDGIVYFGCRDSNLYALNAKTGMKIWSFNNKGSWVIVSPAVYQGRIYFGTSDSGKFYALDAKTGEQQFTLKFMWLFFSSPSIAGNTLYIGSHWGKVFTLDLTTQKPGWEFQTDSSKENAPAISSADGNVDYSKFIFDNFYDDYIMSVRKMMTLGSFFSSPVIDRNVVYIGSTDGNLYALM